MSKTTTSTPAPAKGIKARSAASKTSAAKDSAQSKATSAPSSSAAKATKKTTAAPAAASFPPLPDLPTLTKAELADTLLEHLPSMGRREAHAAVDGFFAILSRNLVQGQEVKLPGLGNFHLRDKSPRPGRNPRTGELVPIQARRVVTFHPSAKLRQSMLEADEQATA